jgi:alkanesulfonate monooxygenase SsuD/methylene tetrahydromethanopterin reductase-like flavin-dependent oxidoreductase (luciferase family)
MVPSGISRAMGRDRCVIPRFRSASWSRVGIGNGRLNLVRHERPTLRQLLASLAGARGHFTAAGAPEQIADLIEDWFSDGAADGFNIMPPLLPSMLDVFSAEVIPLLQRRGLFRRAYEGNTLREHYGLPWPNSAFEATRSQAYAPS